MSHARVAHTCGGFLSSPLVYIQKQEADGSFWATLNNFIRIPDLDYSAMPERWMYVF